MEKTGWKIIAIVFICLFLIETSLWIWMTFDYMNQEKETYECYYNLCEDYPDALYERPLCTCYDYSMLGELIVAKTHYIN